MGDSARIWSEVITIPTYGIGEPLKQPLFLHQRVYQGSSGVVYPYPVIDQVFDEKRDQNYTAVFLENQYLKIMVLPELGGRVQMALDKTNNYHFVYYNQVIKPALVGLTGPWISGGIEFNWPQHHRPSTFLPVDWRIVSNDDGSVTLWCSEVEQMFFTKGMHSFTLHPDKAVLQVDVQLSNRTSEPQTFLWWANPAVHVNDEYQSVFPPDVHAVMDHGKRDVSQFPIAKGTYYKVDYAPGTDISRYKNIPVPTSYMAYHSDYDFVGNYDYSRQAGMMHVANHHLVPGKKQWTWGNSDFGQMWDRQLTDEDGPYIELMCGAFTDNQPDFSWLMPGEEKRFQQNFMPYKNIGPASNANTDAVVHLHVAQDVAQVGVYVSSPVNCRVTLHHKGNLLWQRELPLSPTITLSEQVPLPVAVADHELTLRVTNRASAQELISYTPPRERSGEIPAPATPAADPSAIASSDELFLNGLHLEQYRHATYHPQDYYMEALRRDPHDSRCNNAMGLLLLRRGDFAAAEQFLRRAISRLTSRNPNPYDGEAYYNLGVVLRYQGRLDEAFDAFYKATWNAAWQDSAFFELACIAGCQQRLPQALDLVRQALHRNSSHHRARFVEISLLRRLGRRSEAIMRCNVALQLDPMDASIANELVQLGESTTIAAALRWDIPKFEAVALDYLACGDYDMALGMCTMAPQYGPMLDYLAAWIHDLRGTPATVNTDEQIGASTLTDWVQESLRVARLRTIDWCFPHRLIHVPLLQFALQHSPSDGNAAYLLGNFWYAHQMPDRAIECWQHAVQHTPDNAVAWRNLGLAYVNHHQDLPAGRDAYQRARILTPLDARLLYEADQLAQICGVDPTVRLSELTHNLAVVLERDDLTIAYVTLLNIHARYAEALDILTTRMFHPWEGGEGRVAAQHTIAIIGMAELAMQHGQFGEAITFLYRAVNYPVNLGEGKLPGANENNLHYLLGIAYTACGDTAAAQQAWQLATRGDSQPTSAIYYNDQPPDMIFYQGLAWRRLGDHARAEVIFQHLIAFGQSHADDQIRTDYFAVSLPSFLVFNDNASLRNHNHCLYMQALGMLGLANPATDAAFELLLTRDAHHQGARYHRDFRHC